MRRFKSNQASIRSRAAGRGKPQPLKNPPEEQQRSTEEGEERETVGPGLTVFCPK